MADQNKPQEQKPQQQKNTAKKEKKPAANANANNTRLKDLLETPEKPEFIDHRLKIYEAEKKRQEEELAKKPQTPIKITLPDGKSLDGVAFKTSPFDIAMSISKGLAESAVVAKVNGELWDLTRPLEKDSSLELIKFDNPEGKKVFWHSSAHVLGQALERIYGAKLTVGPPLEEGFYYDSRTDQTVSQDDFDYINATVNRLTNEKQTFERLTVPKEVALEMFKYNPYKHSILSSKVPEGGNCTVYKCGSLIDPCKGPHLPHTGRVKAFQVTKNSSAYWQGNAENDLLQRVYAISFPDPKQMKEWVVFQEEAERRSHRNIGKNQELFFFHPLSPGSCFFMIHGTRIYNKLVEFMRNEYRHWGFTEVISPNAFNTKLWETSGHWANYKENMFSFQAEDQLFALKPMNCPGHCLIFGHRSRSYRELPLRFAEFGVLHRNEFSGALTGLTRVRRFVQDDAHIFCAEDQIKTEIQRAINFMKRVYGIFGFEFSLELSTRPEKYMGEIEVWNKAEKELAEALDGFKAETGIAWKLNPGDGAFYGPKIDIHIRDALGRSYQCATIQLDFQLPIRFNLEYVDAEEKLRRPVIIHRAILGSVERMFAILTEHTAGKWPFWLSPRQAIVIPISEKVFDYANEIAKQFSEAGFFVDADLSDKKFQKKIPLGQTAGYNFMLVVGEQEKTNRTVNVRPRDTDSTKESFEGQAIKVDDMLQKFQQLAKEFK